MSVFKKKEKKQSDFGYEDLPHNRLEVFKTLFHIRFGFLLKTLSLASLFMLPLLGWNTYGRVVIRILLSSLSSTNEKEIYSQVFGFLLIRGIPNVLCFFLMVIGVAGMIRVYRKLAWSEITYLSDFFDGFRKNVLRYLFLAIASWASYTIFLYSFYAIKAVAYGPLIIGLILGIALLQLGFVLSFCFYAILQNDIYEIGFFSLLSNSFKFVFKSFLPVLGLLAILFAPRILLLFGGLYWDVASSLLFLALLCPTALAITLIGLSQLDKWINRDNYHEIFDKGIYR